MPTRLFDELIAGPALALYRYRTARGALKKLSGVRDTLTERHLRNLRGYPDRIALLRSLPRTGHVAEVGVADGRFAAQILRHADPNRLYLIDYWRSGRRAHGYFPGFRKTRVAAASSDYETVANAFADEIASGRVRLLRGCSWEHGSRSPASKTAR